MGVVISSSLYLSPLSGGYPLKNARIGWQSIAAKDNVIGSSEAAGFPAEAAVNPLSYDYWIPEEMPATWTVDAGSAQDVDYVGIAAHTFDESPTNITVESSVDGDVWTELIATISADGTPVMAIFEKTFARYWRVTFSGDTPPQIGVIYIGELLSMQRSIYGGHSPITLSRNTEWVGNMSDTGQTLGTSIVRKGVSTSYEWKNLTAAWYREYFDPFVKATRGAKPFFIAWNPEQFPKEVGYLQAKMDIRPSNMGIRDYMDVSFSAAGISDE